MAQIVGGFASSHAYAFLDPDQWDRRREMTRANYARRYGVTPADRPEVATETLGDNRVRYARIRGGLEHIRAEFERLKPDAWVLIGDDQDENYLEDNLPQFAIYIGDQLVSRYRGEQGGPSTGATRGWPAPFWRSAWKPASTSPTPGAFPTMP